MCKEWTLTDGIGEQSRRPRYFKEWSGSISDGKDGAIVRSSTVIGPSRATPVHHGRSTTANLGVCMLNPRFKAKCDEVGRLIAPTDTPPWLTEYFVHWATPLGSEWSVALLQPTKTEMKEQLTSIVEAADALDEALSNPVTKAFLERAHSFAFDKEFAGFRDSLLSIQRYAYLAARSPALSTAAGKTRSGRGKAPVPGAHNPKIFCALVVAEAWKFLHGKYPGAKNKNAAEAALAFWSVSGGAPAAGWGKDRLGAWRPYFEKAGNPELASRRAECLRILCAVKSGA